jgi:hypothetical protein
MRANKLFGTRLFMNIAIVEDEIDEALIHLKTLIAELRSGEIQKDDEPALAIQLGHTLDHISRAWNCKDMTQDQKTVLSQGDFERLSNTVPNFLGERVLGDCALS